MNRNRTWLLLLLPTLLLVTCCVFHWSPDRYQATQGQQSTQKTTQDYGP